jgi:hypothetical protein
MAFVDYDKAFDSIEITAVLNDLTKQGIEKTYITLLEQIYADATAAIKLSTESRSFKLERGVRQGDTISPKLFIACLEDLFRKLDWKNLGIKINNQELTNLRFADDIVLITTTPQNLQHMITTLEKESLGIGLKMNRKKTQVMFNSFAQTATMFIEGAPLLEVDHYTYLGQYTSTIPESRVEKEVSKRIGMALSKFGKLSRYFKNEKFPMCLK